MKITILPDDKNTIFDNLNKLGNTFTTSYCGGKGLCGKCLIKVISGECSPRTANEAKFLKNKPLEYRLACQTKALTMLEIEIADESTDSNILGAYEGDFSVDNDEDGYGIAIDIGTTSLALFLVNLKNGLILNKLTSLNNQKKYGADVISRIAYSEEHDMGLKQEQRTIVSQLEIHINTLLSQLKIPLSDLKKVVIAANTTMMHLLTGENPSKIARAPFIPNFLEERTYTGTELGMSIECPFYLIGGISAYVGADITAGIHSSGFQVPGKVNALFDLGTNGEIALWNKDRIITCSCAAGPVFEGASISCGCGSINGAINEFHLEKDGKISFKTIGDKPVIGICGSGIIDLVAILIETEIIDETGAMEDDYKIEGTDLSFTLKDVREVQYAKAAIAAGIEILLNNENLSFKDIDEVYLAGGLGTFLNPKSAVTLGLVPIEDPKKIKAIGNSSLKGALECLVSDKAKEDMVKIRQASHYIELSTNKDFQEIFVENMMFGLEDD
jgi:uncharacterized 2Fe-2S/4Fe-4S cluster protein (DUF4445 family)